MSETKHYNLLKDITPYCLPLSEGMTQRFKEDGAFVQGFDIGQSKKIVCVVWLLRFFGEDWRAYYNMFFTWMGDKYPESKFGGMYVQEGEYERFVLILREICGDKR